MLYVIGPIALISDATDNIRIVARGSDHANDR